MAFGHFIPAKIFRSILCFPNFPRQIALCLKCHLWPNSDFDFRFGLCNKMCVNTTKEKTWADATGDVLQKLTWSDLELSQLKFVGAVGSTVRMPTGK